MIVTRWGSYEARYADAEPAALVPIGDRPDPSPIVEGMVERQRSDARIRRPAVRKGFLEARRHGRTDGGDDAGRGSEPTVEVDWDEALDLAAAEIARVRAEHGNGSIYGGSYG